MDESIQDDVVTANEVAVAPKWKTRRRRKQRSFSSINPPKRHQATRKRRSHDWLQQRVSTLFRQDGRLTWYAGVVRSYCSTRGHLVEYDDGDTRYHKYLNAEMQKGEVKIEEAVATATEAGVIDEEKEEKEAE